MSKRPFDWKVGDVVEQRDESRLTASVQTRRYRITAVGEDGYLARELYCRYQSRSLNDGQLHTTFETNYPHGGGESHLSGWWVSHHEWKAINEPR